MKFKNKIIISLFLGLLIIGFLGCNQSTTNTETTNANEEVSIVGEYLIDITDLGMPLVFYLRIDADDNFILSPDRTYETDKGHGTVGSSGNTYMLIYSDSTPDTPKTSTFEVLEGNLHFKSTLPYGASNLPASKEDDNDPNIVYYLLGKVLVYEDYFGEYAGSHTVSAMGSEVVYDYYLQLNSGREFKFVSNFTMNQEPYEFVETGFYDVDDGVVTLHLEGETVTGQFDSNRNLTIGIKASEMADRTERVLQVATTAACASIYYGYATKEMGGVIMYDTEMVSTLDKFGGYTFTGNDLISGEYSETGSFTIDGNNLVFSPADSDDTYTGSLVNFVVTAPFKVSSATSTRTEVTFYCKTIQGEFSAQGQDELENDYEAKLLLNSDGTFSLTLNKGEETLIDQLGSFSVRRFIFMQLILIAEDETRYELVISEVGLNVNFTLADETIIGFLLKKE